MNFYDAWHIKKAEAEFLSDKIIDNLLELFEEETALEWLNTPNPLLEGATPINFLRTPESMVLIERALERLGR